MTQADESQAAVAELRHELARGDVALAGVAPVLSHLLASSGQALVSEDLVARMRGMLGNLAIQILRTEAEVSGGSRQLEPTVTDELASKLASSGILVSHCYAIAMESQLAEQLEQTHGIDQVLTPLLQELIASPDENMAELAMGAMTAQARFVQAQRRMNLPLAELPAELFHDVIAHWSAMVGDRESQQQERVFQVLRGGYDESSSRLGLLTRVMGSLGHGLRAAIDLEHAGFALFASGLARASRQPRELAVLSCHERQATRLALALRAAGLKPEEMRKQFLLIQSDLAMPSGADVISQEGALSLIAGAPSGGVG
uniref:hypothetical protein n=1 Tax=uncultured Altererythrobacter sp. TaxID=500840 RepID=UPI002611A040|nr:hypothetical protein [uncultured Altererythrobacter sp.]